MKKEWRIGKLVIGNPFGFCWHIMSLISLIVIVVGACTIKKTDESTIDPKDQFYRNFDMIIVNINGADTYIGGSSTSVSDRDNQQTQSCNVILLETTYRFEEKYGVHHMYREINTCKDPTVTEDTNGCGCGQGFHIDTKWLYNHKAGDEVHFDYMLKRKFFESELLDAKRNK
ncbi:MAG: hypothetical protein WC428_02170 [Candidatus Paceibacterota bacterium]|jgi:hypothetical protein